MKLNVLMIGPARSVKGGMTTVVDNYYEAGLDKIVNLKYLETCNDSKNIFSKILKECKGFLEFNKEINHYDIVHIHMASRRSTFRKGKYVRIAKENGKKVIIHIHGAEYKMFYDECNEKQKKYVKNTLALADRVIVLSEEWKEFFENLVDEKKIEVIYNAIVVPENFEKNLDNKKILFLGRIGERKGIYDLIDVIQKIIKEMPDVKLYVGGDGEIDKLKSLIKEKMLKENVIYIGWINGEAKSSILKDSSFYILPSYNEGMPMSVLEGMAYKNVVISTKVGGIPEVIKNMENGVIIEPGDKISLYENIMNLLKNEALRRKMSDRARKIVEEKFNIENNIKKVLHLYNELDTNNK